MSRLAKLLPAVDQRSWWSMAPNTDGRIPTNAEIDGTYAGLPVSEATALRLIDVYACVSLLADSVAQLPLDAYAKQGNQRVELDRTPRLIDQPDPELERWDHISRMVTSLALRGNSYNAILARDSAGFATAVRAIHPDDCTPVREGGRKVFRLAGGHVVDAGDIIHIPLVTLPGSVAGLSPLECARRGIRLAVATEDFGEKWFIDGATPSSILESDTTPEDPDTEGRRIQAKWIASHGGRRRPAVLFGGLKWKAITVSPNESQFLETRGLNATQIAKIWRVPAHYLGDTTKATSFGRGLEELGIGFVVFTLGAYLMRLEAAFTRQLPRPQYARFNVAAFLRGNTKDRYLAHAIGRQWGWLSVNDVRALEDLPPLAEGGDVYLQPLNMIDAEAALKKLLFDNTPHPDGGAGPEPPEG